jgi:hypothetical protein
MRERRLLATTALSAASENGIPGSWHLRIVYTDAIPFLDPRQESHGAGHY